jgi:hypothetical protein
MIDITSIGDFRREYMQDPQRDPTITVVFCDKPVVLDNWREITGEKIFRVSIWMPGEQLRTKPLVEERFTHDEFYTAVHEAAKTMSHGYTFPPGGRDTGFVELFLIEWAKKNWREIEKAEYRRSCNMGPFGSLEEFETTATIPTRTYKGEDGRTYTELDLRGEDTDPVLLNATKNREHILKLKEEEAQRERDRRIREAALRAERERLEQERKDREQAEFEAIPGFGSF